MIRLFYTTLLIFCALPAIVSAGSLTVTPERVENGNVALLRWEGEPLSFGVARFRDQVIYLYPEPGGAVALLPVDLDAAPGEEPLLVALADLQGRTSAYELSVEILYKQRPEEHLTLPKRMVTPDPADQQRIARERERLNQVYAARSTRLWDEFVRPVDDPISSVFGKRRLMNNLPRAPHSGTDFRSPTGRPVKAISNGRVAYIGDLFYTGNTVVLDHGEGLFSIYAHLSEIDVTDGAPINVGEIVGKVGSTGRSTGAHLHLSVRLLGARIDPMALLSLFSAQDS